MHSRVLVQALNENIFFNAPGEMQETCNRMLCLLIKLVIFTQYVLHLEKTALFLCLFETCLKIFTVLYIVN